LNDSNRAEIFTPARHHHRHLIDILQDIQSLEGYLSPESMQEAAAFLGLPPAAVWGVATFYNQFRLAPPGRNPVKVCMGTACHLAGGQLVLEAMSRELKLEIGATAEDREFSLERVACIGCCALAPVITIGENVYPKMTPPKVEEVLVQVKPAAGSSGGEGDAGI
jgi:NADH-quinone oxidoreductase subunit E